jgi:hypothetical protein
MEKEKTIVYTCRKSMNMTLKAECAVIKKIDECKRENSKNTKIHKKRGAVMMRIIRLLVSSLTFILLLTFSRLLLTRVVISIVSGKKPAAVTV